MVFNNITTPTETEKEERSTTQSEKIDNGEMSFEAVPCMFKSRQENGAEESLFGLLIRPVIASNNNITELNNNTIITNNEQLRDDNNKNILMASTSEDNKKQSSLLSSPSNSIPLSSCSNSIRSSSSVIFASKMLHSHQNVKQIPSTTSLPFLPAPSGVPPILPRPKQQQKRLKNVLLKAPKVIPIQPKIATTTSSTFTSSFHPLQVLSPTTITSNQQISHNNTNLNTSLASCSNNILEGQISGLLTIHSPTSPKLATIKKCQKQKITPIKENKRKEEEEKSSSKQQATPNKLKKYQKRNKEIKKQNKRQIGRTNSEVMLGEDLHEIDLSQLVNSTVITTEDYLPSQLSEPTIYTNLDMYNTPNNACIDLHQQSISSNNNICQNTTTTIPLNQQKGLNFVEHSINNTNNQSLSPIISSELTNLQRPLLSSSSVPSSSTSILCQYNNDQQQQNISTVSVIAPICSNSQPVWHPYLVTHPGISHISSTPDSGIQSIDGSPPSVYTPPMVSPYSSQVRSCESVSATSHGISIGLGPSTSSTISSFPISFNQNNNFESFLQLNNFQLTNSHLPPQLIGQQKVNEDKHFDILPEQEEEERRNENEGLFSDFSDMPKLIPITLSQHDESLDGEDNKEIKKLNDNIFENNNEEKEEEKEEIKRSSNSLTSSTKELINIHKGMTLQELAECISSSIPPEQLKQLTSLIQLKAVNSKEVEIVEKGSSTKLKKDKKELEVEGSNDKTINKNIISNKFGIKKKFKENMISQISNEQQQPSTSSTSTSSIKLNEKYINKTTLKGKEKVNYLSIYRYQVRLQLKQKLDLFIDKVCNQLENTHLNIQRQQQFWKSSHPLQKLDWELINKRLLEKKKEGKEELLFKNETKKHRKRRRIKENYEEKGEREEINKKKKHCNILLL